MTMEESWGLEQNGVQKHHDIEQHGQVLTEDAGIMLETDGYG